MRGFQAILLTLGLLLMVTFGGARDASAEGVPQLLNVQGVLYDNDGNPVNGQAYDISLRLYTSDVGGAPIAQEITHGYVVNDGIFHVTMTMAGNPFKTYPALWLGIQVDTDAEMAPRQRITSVGYAFEALHSDEATLSKDLSCGDGTAGNGCVQDTELDEMYARRLGPADFRAQSAAGLDCVGECVQSFEIADGTVATVDLGDSVVTSAKIADSNVFTADLAPNAVTTDKLADGAVETGDLKDSAVTSAKIADGGVQTADLLDTAVTNAKIAGGAVTSDKIADGTITSADIGAGQVRMDNILDAAVVSSKIGGIIAAEHLPIATKTDRGTVIVGDYLAVDVNGKVTIDIQSLNPSLKATLPVGRNLVQWEDKTEYWDAVANTGTVQVADGTVTAPPAHGGKVFRFAGADTFIYTRDMIPVDLDREYFGGVWASKGSGATPTFSAGVRLFDKDGNYLGDNWFIVNGASLNSNGTYFQGKLQKPHAISSNTRYVQPVVVVTNVGGGFSDVDSFQLYELSTANDVACVGCVNAAAVKDGDIGTADLAANAVTSAKIADGTIASGDIGTGAVTSGNIADGGIATGDLADGSVTTAKLGDGAVTSGKILDGSITGTDILDGTITSGKIASGTIETFNLQDGAVTSGKILDGTIATQDLGDNVVTGAKLAPDAVTTANILDGAVTGPKIAAGAVGNTQLAADAVTTDKIANGTIDPADLNFTVPGLQSDIYIDNNNKLVFSDDAGSTDQAYFVEGTTGAGDGIEVRLVLGNNADANEKFTIYGHQPPSTYIQRHSLDAAGNAIHTGALSAASLTTTGAISSGGATITGNLQCTAAGCIDTNEILNGTITDVDLAATADIDPSKIAGTALTQSTVFGGDVSGVFNNLQIGTGMVGTNELAAGAVTNAKLADNAVDSGKLADNAVITSKIADGAVTGPKLAADSVDSSKVAPDSLTDADLGAGSVGASELIDGSVGSLDIQNGAIMSIDLMDGQIQWQDFSTDNVNGVYAGNGTSGQLARSDHNHDATYLKSAAGTANKVTGDLYVEHAGATGVIIRSNNGGQAFLDLSNDTTTTPSDARFLLNTDDEVRLQGASLAVESGGVSALTLTGDLVCTGCVAGGEIANGAITDTNVAAGAGIAASKIAGVALTQSTGFGGDVSGTYNSIDLGANVVGSAELADGSVTLAKMAGDSVNSAKIVNESIQSADILNGTIVGADIQDSSIGAGKLANLSVSTNNLQDTAVTSGKVADNAINAAKIQDNSVTSADIQDGTIAAVDLAFTVPGLGADVTIEDGRHIYFNDAGETNKQAYFQEMTTGTGSIDVGLVLGNQANDTETFSIYGYTTSTDLKHQFKADGTSFHKRTTFLGGAAAWPSGVNPATDLDPNNGNIVFDGGLIKQGTFGALLWSPYFEIRADNAIAPLTHSYMRGTAGNLYIEAGSSGTGPLYLNYQETEAKPGTVYVGGDLNLTHATATFSCTGCVTGTAIANNAINTNHIAADTILAGDIADGAVGTDELAGSAVTSAKIADGTIANADIAAGTIVRDKIAPDTLMGSEIAADAIGASELADGSVDSAAIIDGTILAADLSADAVASGNIVDGTVTSADLQDNSVTSADILNGTILAEDLAFSIVGSGGSLTVNNGNTLTFYNSSNGANDNGFFKQVAVGDDNYELRLNFTDNVDATEKFTIYTNDSNRNFEVRADGYVFAGGAFEAAGAATLNRDLSMGGCDFSMTQTNCARGDGGRAFVHDTSDTLAINYAGDFAGGTRIDGNVSFAGNLTLAATRTITCTGCVNGAAVADGSITGTDVQDATIDGVDIVNGGVALADLAGNSVDASKIVDGSVGSNDLADGAVTSAKIAGNAVNDTHIADNSIAAAKITGTALTGAAAFGGDVSGTYNNLQINGGAVGNAKLATNAVTTDKVSDGTLTCNDVNSGSILCVGNVGATMDPTYLRRDGTNTMSGTLRLEFNGSLGIENRSLNGGTPYIDFSNDSGTDFDGRIILSNDDQLTVDGANLVVNGNVTSNNDYASKFWDKDNTDYYVDPASTTNLNSLTVASFSTTGDITANNFYANDWFRNNQVDEGLYNQATGRHFYSGDASYWVAASGNGMQFRNSHEGTITGYVYWDGTAGSNNFGLLSPDGSWSVRATNSEVELYHTVRAEVIYDSNNAGYRLDPNAQSYTYEFYRTYGFDGPEYDGNNNDYYVDPNGTTYMNDFRFNVIPCANGYCPSYNAVRMTPNFHFNTLAGYATIINWDNGAVGGTTQQLRVGNGSSSDAFYVTAGGTAWASGDMRAPIFYDTNDTGYYVDPNSGSNVSTIYADNWFRSYGATGWYNQTYGGGINMEDSTSVRVYGNKQFYNANLIRSDTDMRAPIFYDQNDTSFYVDPNGTSRLSVLYSDIFYDRNDSGYYVDPASTTRLNVLNVNVINATDINATCSARGGTNRDNGCPEGWNGAGDVCFRAGNNWSGPPAKSTASHYCAGNAGVASHLCSISDYTAINASQSSYGDLYAGNTWYWTSEFMLDNATHYYGMLWAPRSGLIWATNVGGDTNGVVTPGAPWNGYPFYCCRYK